MKLSKRPHKKSIAMNMTPMIDVVFLLIIYFMTAAQLSEVKIERIELAKIHKGGEKQEESNLTVNVNRQGQIIVNHQKLSLSEFVVEVGEQLALVGGEPARVTVKIRADGRSPSRTVNEVVKRLEVLGIRQVQFGVEKTAE